MDESASAQESPITPANLLTYSRLVLLPIVIAGVATHHGYLAVGAMAVLLVTDLLDGRIARLMGQAGSFGKTLDSTVDFVLIYSLFIALYASGRIATYQFAFLYLSMLTILSLQFALSAVGRSGELPATADKPSTALGKATGALQYGYLLFVLAREVTPKARALAVADIIFFVVLAVAIVLNSAECIVRVCRMTARSREGAPPS